MKVSSIDKDIKTILESGFYQIPRFQRPYSWDNDNVVEFWKDITGEGDDEYFIGSMVVFKKQQSHFGIVDGQQRLTTLTIVLSALRDHLNSLKEVELAKGVQRLIAKKDIDNIDQFILQTETSYPYLHQCIQSFENTEKIKTITDEEKALKDAFELLMDLINLEMEKLETDLEKIDYLKKLRDKVLKLKVIFIELDNEDDAYIIFETLNTRGKDLQPSDLVKNLFTKLLKNQNKKLDRVSDKWKALLENIQTSKIDIDINAFIYHYWLSKESYTTQNKLFKEFKTNVNKDNAKTYLESLLQESRYYRAIYEPSYIKWSNEEVELKKSLEALSVFRVKQPLPIVLAIVSEYYNKNLKLKNAKKYLQYIENFHFIHTAITSQRSSGGLSSYYAKKARELRQADTESKKIAVLNNVKNKLSKDKTNYEEFKIAFRNLKYSDKYTKNKKLIQYILTKIDQIQRKNTPIDYGLMTIEHVASQSDSSVSDDAIACIGNLVFVSSDDNNKVLKNKKFSEKSIVFSDNYSHFDTILLKANAWGDKEILKRADHISDMAYKKIWIV